jgi:hypothetical protein
MKKSISKLLIINTFLIVNVFFCNAQSVTDAVGGQRWMLGGTSAAHVNAWSAANNAGAITEVSSPQIGLYNEQRFGNNNLRLNNISFVSPVKKYLHIGGFVNYFGYQAFNQQKIGMSVAKKLSETLSLGVQANYVATNIEGYGSTGTMAFGVGVMVKPIIGMRIGFTVFNITQQTYPNATPEAIQPYAKLGLAYDVSEKITLHTEADQVLNQDIIIRGGILYKIHPIVQLALGAASKPVYYTGGTSLLIKKLRLDIAVSIHEVLGVTPHIGISYKF